jgi:hypothetical protein
MSSRHKKSRTVASVEHFGGDMSAVHKLIIKHANGLHTDGEHYRALADLHEKLCEVTLAVSGEAELPWVAHMRGHPWPTRKP